MLESFHLTRLLDGMALVMRTSCHGPFFGRGSDDEGVVDSSEPPFRLVLWGARDRAPSDRLNESTVHIPGTVRPAAFRSLATLAGVVGSLPSPGTPVYPVSVEWAAAPGHLDVLFTQDVRVFGQSTIASAGLKLPAAAVVDAPVLGRDPFVSLVEGDVEWPRPAAWRIARY